MYGKCRMCRTLDPPLISCICIKAETLENYVGIPSLASENYCDMFQFLNLLQFYNNRINRTIKSFLVRLCHIFESSKLLFDFRPLHFVWHMVLFRIPWDIIVTLRPLMSISNSVSRLKGLSLEQTVQTCHITCYKICWVVNVITTAF